MAQQGNYKDPPARRMAYDTDGTVVLFMKGNKSEVYQFTSGDMVAINDESSNKAYGIATPFRDETQYLVFIFPELRTLSHYYASCQKGYYYADLTGTLVEYSSNTTNGSDGTWESLADWQTGTDNTSGSEDPTKTPGPPDYREKIENMSVPACVGLRFKYSTTWAHVADTRFYAFHLYGKIAPGETPHRISFCDDGGTELPRDQDFGDQPRGSTRIWGPDNTTNQPSALHIRNKSGSLTAEEVVISCEDVADSIMASYVTLSTDGINYAGEVSFSSLAPGQMAGPIWVKYATDLDMTIGLTAARLRAHVAEWN